MIRNIYLASGFNRRYELRKLASELMKRGHTITSRWILVEERPARDSVHFSSFAFDIALQNKNDLKRSDTLVIDSAGIKADNKGGVHTELGWFLAKELPIYLIGRRGNTFHFLPEVKVVGDYEQLIEQLSFYDIK